MRKIAAIAAGIAIIGTLGISGPAFAGSYDGDCDDSEMCAYDGENFSGKIFDRSGSLKSYGGYKFYQGGGIENRFSSVKNTANTYKLCLYTKANYRGKSICVGSDKSRKSLGAQYNNTASSNRFIHTG
ncbi:peptidase inhibitor family I36 protein [Streptomyces alboflavus]|uniref:peptidase inhibitor family I36 protein n=1 Tax=Streptomyces alboflavus TaxID=67267 RepID=UPI0036979C4D